MTKCFLCFILIIALLMNTPPTAYATDGTVSFEDLQSMEMEGFPYDFTQPAVIDGLDGTLNDFMFTVQSNADVTLRNIILRYNTEGLSGINHIINVISGSLTLENVRIYFDGAVEDYVEINTIRISSKGAAAIKAGLIYSPGREGAAILCEGEAKISEGSSIYGNVIVKGAAWMQVTGADIFSEKTPLTINGGMALLQAAGIFSSDGVSPAISLADGTGIEMDQHCRTSWPLMNDVSQMGVMVSGIVETISLPAEVKLAPGAQEQLEPDFGGDGAFSLVRWEIEDESVATINQSGNVHALTEGETEIRAAIPNGETAVTKLIVENKADESGPDENGPEQKEAGGTQQNSQPSYQQAIIFAPTYPDLAPPPKVPPIRTIFKFYEFISETEFYAGHSGTNLISTAPERDFVIVLGMDADWAHVIWEGVEGYVQADSLYEFNCVLETMSAQAIFTKRQGIYDYPGGSLIDTIDKDTLTLSISTRGKWTALYHDGKIVYSPASGLRLHPVEPDVLYTMKSGSFLTLAPDEISEVVVYLGPYTPLEIISDVAGYEEFSHGWLLAKVADFMGYVREDHLVAQSPWVKEKFSLSEEERAMIFAQSDVYWREDAEA